MITDAGALVIGAGPSGASTAILLATAGWRVLLVEQQVYPRQKVCGECLTAGSLALFDELGVGDAVLERAGPELTRVGWMSRARTIVADLPPCSAGPHRYGRALGRDLLDVLLLERARAAGVDILQPAKVRSVRGAAGHFECEIEVCRDRSAGPARARTLLPIRAPIVIDAHGSWEGGPEGAIDAPPPPSRRDLRNSDLFGFKASFAAAALPKGLLPVLSFSGGYGGMVLAEDGRLTLACCIRRDTLRECRARNPGTSAGGAVEHYLRASCPAVQEVLRSAQRTGPWLAVGPLRPGIRIGQRLGPLLVGNAAGETHPLIGEGINMALQSAFLLTRELVQQPVRAIGADRYRQIQGDYGHAWRSACAQRLRLAAGYAHLAMLPAPSAAATALLLRWPRMLTRAARWAGKARNPTLSSALCEGTP